METIVAPADTPALLAAATEQAITFLKDGEVVALPTETVYGLAANALRESAVAKVFEAKDRPHFDPLICHLPTLEWLDLMTRIPPESRGTIDRLVESLWPGPLTLVLPKSEIVPDIVTSGLPTVAVRMSIHPIFREICELFRKPLAAPSANRFGRLSPTSAEHVAKELDGRIPLVVDGGRTMHGIESTIVAVEGGTLRVLRDGPITREELSRFGDVVIATAGGDRPEAPGQLASHYAPQTELWLATPALKTEISALAGSGKRVGLLAWDSRFSPLGIEPERTEVLSLKGDLREAAAKLFAKLRRLDDAGLDLILAEPVPETGLGVAIMDRLRRAATRE